MAPSELFRRRMLLQGGGALASLSVLRIAGPAHAFQTPVAGEVVPWLDQLEENPVPDVIVRQLDWTQLDSWQTPTDEFFVIKHFNEPQLDPADWRLEIGGLVVGHG
jgi:DMSO/TMAO reductase YedYZ molybdopterin-dependent catalytic subunit